MSSDKPEARTPDSEERCLACSTGEHHRCVVAVLGVGRCGCFCKPREAVEPCRESEPCAAHPRILPDSLAQPTPLHWPWNEFPEDFSTWEECVNQYKQAIAAPKVEDAPSVESVLVELKKMRDLAAWTISLAQDRRSQSCRITVWPSDPEASEREFEGATIIEAMQKVREYAATMKGKS